MVQITIYNNTCEIFHDIFCTKSTEGGRDQNIYDTDKRKKAYIQVWLDGC